MGSINFTKSKDAIKHFAAIILSPHIKERSERLILSIAIISYIVHLLLIMLIDKDLIRIQSNLLSNPIAAIYTPFSFILLYEVYLLVFFLPQSITTYIGKQYEIITLIVIRRIFKDIANLELQTDWFNNRYDLQFTYDVATSLILFLLIFLFYKSSSRSNLTRSASSKNVSDKISRFINLKKTIAILLLPLLAILAFYAFFNWTIETINDYQKGILIFANINNVFFDEFFTVLIMIDVLLLLFTFFYSDEFHKIIRNSGFVISTILIKISFSEDGLLNNVLIIGAVLFGYLILLIHNKYEKHAETITSSHDQLN
jgi:hypothetical protein